MKNKSFCTSLILLSSTSLYATSVSAYKIKEGDNLNLILDKFIDFRVGPSKSSLYLDILKYNKFIKNPNMIYPGVSLVLPKLYDVMYEVKSGDTLSSIVRKHKHLAPHLSFGNQVKKTIRANAHIKNPDLIEVGDKIFVGKSYDDGLGLSYEKSMASLKPTIKGGVVKKEKAVAWKSIDRAIASVKQFHTGYFYADELGFEIRKMNPEEAKEYIVHFQKLTKTKSPDRWRDIFSDVVEISSNEKHENIERAFSLYSIDIEEDGNIARTREEVKEFLKVWMSARNKRLRL